MADPVLLVVERQIAAPPEAVFDAWLDPAKARTFLFATEGGVMETCRIDARIGGEALIVERRPQGLAEHFLQFEEIERPHRLVFLFRATMAGEGSKPGEWTRVMLEFRAAGGGTHLTLTHAMAPEWAEYEDRTRHGWTMILGNLAKEMER